MTWCGMIIYPALRGNFDAVKNFIPFQLFTASQLKKTLLINNQKGSRSRSEKPGPKRGGILMFSEHLIGLYTINSDANDICSLWKWAYIQHFRVLFSQDYLTEHSAYFYLELFITKCDVELVTRWIWIYREWNTHCFIDTCQYWLYPVAFDNYVCFSITIRGFETHEIFDVSKVRMYVIVHELIAGYNSY